MYECIYVTVCVFGSLISDVACNYVSADGGRDGPWWPALLGHWLSYTGCWQYLLVMYWLLFGVLFLFLTTSLGCFCPRTLQIVQSVINGLNKLPWTSYLHAILRIISKGVSGLATDSPCGVWGRGWTTCLLHDSPLFSLHILNESWYVTLEWDFIYLLLFLASVHGCMHETSDFFYSIIAFSYSKYFVDSYTVYVVFTLSYVRLLRNFHPNWIIRWVPFVSANSDKWMHLLRGVLIKFKPC